MSLILGVFSYFWRFLLNGIGFVVAEIAGLEVWYLFWTDITQHNPHRSLGHAIMLIPLMGIPVGFVLAILSFSGALALAAAVASVWRWRLGSVPLPLIMLLLPVGALLAYAQTVLLFDSSLYLNGPEDVAERAGAGRVLLNVSAFLFPAYFGAWWRLRKAGLGSERASAGA